MSTASATQLGSTTWQWANLGQPTNAKPNIGASTTTAGGHFNAFVLDEPGNLWACWLNDTT